ncbi:hypothetical protein H6G45_06355 [Synechocystis sp. FACHB-383]|uniref:DNA N-6-adenine-methyltransferase n=1 Tax=Synechocystis sp. FACHB-383 TaxID=2692864 RepID=UPI001683F5CC|nr:DNA N-6-adenine-methyltransferase [Synechocystis sp. FACHB-383]MBD2653114.1 hypothetical protein [Synechocystis sp. FACHB-383]
MTKPTDENYTPNTKDQPILDLVVEVLGVIDLDPCANEAKTVPAKNHFTRDDDSLSCPWQGKTFLNPPYSKPLPFLKKLCIGLDLELVPEAIALLKSGTVHNKGTGALIEQYATAICFWGAGKNRRIGFINQHGEQKLAADFDCVLVYFGLNYRRFRKVFKPFGHVVYGDRVIGGKHP